MRKLALLLIFMVMLPCYAIGSEYADIVAKIEEKIKVKDFKGAQEILRSSPIYDDRMLYMDLEREIESVGEYAKRYDEFKELAAAKDKTEAIHYYHYLVQGYNALPDSYHFSPEFSSAIASAMEGSIDRAEKLVNKECGDDYGQIRVGMKLERAEKCNGEFYLHGQVQYKGSTVDYYTRGDTYLYISNGKVVAWGG